MENLLSELNRHRELMFFTIGKALKDCADLHDGEAIGLSKACCQIYDKKLDNFKIKKEDNAAFEKIAHKIGKVYLFLHGEIGEQGAERRIERHRPTTIPKEATSRKKIL
jgi:hypothetical protein